MQTRTSHNTARQRIPGADDYKRRKSKPYLLGKRDVALHGNRKQKGAGAHLPERRPARNGFLTSPLPQKTFFRGKEQMLTEEYTRLRDSIRRLCHVKGILAFLEETGNNILDLKNMISEVNSLLPANEKLNLIEDDYDSKLPLQLTHDRLLHESNCLHMICLKPTYKLRQEVGDVVRRFLVTFCQRNGINDIRDTPTYSFIKEDLEMRMEDEHEDNQEANEQYQDVIEPYENGEVNEAFASIYRSLNEKPYSPEEAEQLMPQEDHEKRIIEIIKEGSAFLNPSCRITMCSGLPDAEEEAEVSVNAEDSFVLSYDCEDSLNDTFYDFINMTYQSTGISAGIVDTVILRPDTRSEEFDDEMDKIHQYITKLNNTF